MEEEEEEGREVWKEGERISIHTTGTAPVRQKCEVVGGKLDQEVQTNKRGKPRQRPWFLWKLVS